MSVRLMVVVLFLCGAAGCTQNKGSPVHSLTESEIQDIRRAATAFVNTLNDEDFDAVRDAFRGSRHELKTLRLVHQLLHAVRTMASAVDQEFPPGEDDPIPSEFRESRMTIAETEITLLRGSAWVDSVELRRVAGEWKVVGLDIVAKYFLERWAPIGITVASEALAGLKENRFQSRLEVAEFLKRRTKEQEDKRDSVRTGSRPAGYPLDAPLSTLH